MIEARATLAIVRRHVDRRFAIDFAIQAALVGALAYAFVPSLGGVALPVLAVLAAASVVETEHVRSLRRLTFFAVPLFGRQLARAHAVAPALASLALPLGYYVGARLRGVPLGVDTAIASTWVVVIATLVALSGTFRDGRERALYVALAIVAGTSVGLAATYARPHALAWAVGLALLEGFVALRAFGETLARYDPLPEPGV